MATFFQRSPPFPRPIIVGLHSWVFRGVSVEGFPLWFRWPWRIHIFFCWLQYLAFFFVPRDSEKQIQQQKISGCYAWWFFIWIGIPIRFHHHFFTSILGEYLSKLFKSIVKRVASHPSCFCIYLRIYTKLFMANQPAHLPTPKKRYPRKYVPGNPSDQGGTP